MYISDVLNMKSADASNFNGNIDQTSHTLGETVIPTNAEESFSAAHQIRSFDYAQDDRT